MVGERELTSGAVVDLFIGGHWISGRIEFWKHDYYWFSSKDEIPVVLRFGVKARAKSGRYTS